MKNLIKCLPAMAALMIAASGASAQGLIIAEVVYWPVTTVDGTRIDCRVDLGDIGWGEGCYGPTVNGLSTPVIFDSIAVQAIRQLLDSNAITPLTTCTWNNVRVHTAACVTRSGSGCTTWFSACDQTEAWREYRVCVSGGVTTITFIAGSAPGCEGNCASTVP